MSVSIVIPAFNSAGYLPATIHSALRQTQRADEVIVIDDGSTDDTEEVCRKFSDKIVYQRKNNQGVAVARNYGASIAKADWLLFLDADDRLMPHAVESLLDAANKSSCSVVYGFVLLRGKNLDD